MNNYSSVKSFIEPVHNSFQKLQTLMFSLDRGWSVRQRFNSEYNIIDMLVSFAYLELRAGSPHVMADALDPQTFIFC